MTGNMTHGNATLVTLYGGRLEYGGPEEGGWWFEREWLLPDVESLSYPDVASAQEAAAWINAVYTERRRAWIRTARSAGGWHGLDRVWQAAYVEKTRGTHEKKSRPSWDD